MYRDIPNLHMPHRIISLGVSLDMCMCIVNQFLYTLLYTRYKRENLEGINHRVLGIHRMKV